MTYCACETDRPYEPVASGRFAGHAITFDCSGAAYFPELSLLVISDLHLERGAAHARRGFFLPPYDTAQTLNVLTAVVRRYQPLRIVSLGDSFHDRLGAQAMIPELRGRLEELAQTGEWIWITGNHDPDGVAGLPGHESHEWNFEGLSFRHEPGGGPLPDAVEGEVCGHLHPAATLKRPGKSVRRPCFAADDKRLMLPAFSTKAGGLDLKHSAFSGLFDRKKLNVHMLGPDRVYSFPFAELNRR